MDTPRTPFDRPLSPAEYLAAPVWMLPVSNRCAPAQPVSEEEHERRRVRQALRMRLSELATKKESGQ